MKRVTVWCLALILALMPMTAFAMPISDDYSKLNDQIVDFVAAHPYEGLGIIANLKSSKYFHMTSFPDDFSEEGMEFYNKAAALTDYEQDLIIMVLSSQIYARINASGETQNASAASTVPPTMKPVSTPEPSAAPVLKKSGTYTIPEYIEIKRASFKTQDKVEAKNASSYEGFGFTGFEKNAGLEMIVCSIKVKNLSKSNKSIFEMIRKVTYTNADGYTFEGTVYAEDKTRQIIQTNTMNLDPNTTYYLHLVCNTEKKNVKLDSGAYMTISIVDPESQYETIDLRIEY